MVRPKLQLERLDGEISRDHYYLHSKEIVSNKVKEMSILTGSDVLFLSFSPDGLPSLHLGDYSNLTDMVTRFAHISYHDREKRRLDNLQTLRSNYQNDEYNIDVNMLFQAWKVKRLEDMKQELNDLYEELARLKKRKCYWENPKKVESIEAIKEMEERLEKSLEGVRQHKVELNVNQMMRIPENPTPIEPFGCYTPEMLSGNDDMLGYAKMLMLSSGGHKPSAMNQHQ